MGNKPQTNQLAIPCLSTFKGVWVVSGEPAPDEPTGRVVRTRESETSWSKRRKGKR